MSSNEYLPPVPETQLIEPIAQCGVLYLGTAQTSSGHYGLDAIQEPFSHRYPIDGTNTARGIDAILSIYSNGIQLSFVRQPYAVVFYPISSLIYCASLRFSIIKQEQNSSVDWRFLPLNIDETNSLTKHPPLFALVTQRTKTMSGNECHCFITKNIDDALTLVRTISDVYAKLKPNLPSIRSPIYYQLDRYGRKLSESTGLIYLSSDNNNHNGYFYRTDGVLSEQWQLWDDEDNDNDDVRSISRPHPPDSPFGLHQGIYHDDIREEFDDNLRFIDEDERPHSSRKHCHHHHHRKPRFISTSSSFDPSSLQRRNVPIIIEKILPQTISVCKSSNETTIEEKQDQTIVVQNHRKKSSKRIPIIDLRKINKQSDVLDIIDGYFEDAKGQKLKFNGHDAQALIDELELLTTKSTQSISYVERSPTTNEQKPIENNSNYISLFRYMQSSVNPQFIQQYHQTFSRN